MKEIEFDVFREGQLLLRSSRKPDRVERGHLFALKYPKHISFHIRLSPGEVRALELPKLPPLGHKVVEFFFLRSPALSLAAEARPRYQPTDWWLDISNLPLEAYSLILRPFLI